MKSILTIFSLIAFTTFSIAQDQKAKTVLDQVSAEMDSYESLRVTCTYAMDNEAADIHEEQEGSLLLQGKKFKLNLAQRIIISNGEQVWVYMPDAEEVHIKAQDDFNEEIGFDPSTIFTIYEEGYKYRYIEDITENGKKLHVVDLYPKEPGEKSFSRIRLKIDQKSSRIVSSKTYGKDGNHYTLTVQEFTPNPNIEEDAFTFKESDYPDAEIEVVDFR